MEIADTTVVVVVETDALDDVSDTNRCASLIQISNICTCFCRASSILVRFSSTTLHSVLPSFLM